MKKYIGIVRSIKAPNTNYLWLKEDGIYYFDISGWKLATNFNLDMLKDKSIKWENIEGAPNYVTMEAFETTIEVLQDKIIELENKIELLIDNK